jgi:DNA-directed RNA polymerase subunit alpha
MISQIQMPEKVIIEGSDSPSHSRFIMQPLEIGYANTVGNALRRVLLSSIPSAAIIGVKITDVLQELQSIPHVVEDVAEIILNLKEVKLKLDDKKINRVQFHVEGPGELTAKAIQDANPSIEVMDPNFHIATLSGKADFDMELRIERGRGYVPAEEQVISNPSVGMLPIDAVFTPVLLANYNVEQQRVGNRTDYERLVLDVRTDGTITAEEAVHTASRILSDHIKLFYNETFVNDDELINNKIQEQLIYNSENGEKERIKKILLTPLEGLELSARATNCLKQANIYKIADLVQLQENELLKFRNFGKKSLTELHALVKMHSLTFGMNVEAYISNYVKPPVPQNAD